MAHGGPASVDGVTLQRAFGWGVLFFGDSNAQPAGMDADAVVTWGSEDEAVAVLVRHAQDIDADVLDALDDDQEAPLVEITVSVHWGATDSADADGFIAVPSGVLVIGDADWEEPLAVLPGRWRVQVSLEPEEHAERVDLWLTPAT
jgi:hypothetical protein